MLSAQAFNAFLKTLEEPPAHVIFILATTERHKILPTILSRCQVYDFNRMSVQNIVNHLKGVAEKEGYEYDMNALNIIAEKADGGMRDALSIFDQVVSYTQGHLLYDKVIENLNVLNYEYYFRFTDYFLENNVAQVMLTFNEILNKGFDASNFMLGLAEHLRNLLVSRDEVTLSLLEVSDDARRKYKEQAQKCTPKFLYSAIKLCNNYDINYRTARNKRLFTEITLIQLAQVTQEDEPGSGRCPENVLKPIFKQIIATAGMTAAPSAAPAANAGASTSAASGAASSAASSAASGAAGGSPVVSARPAANAPVHAMTMDTTARVNAPIAGVNAPAAGGVNAAAGGVNAPSLPRLRRMSMRRPGTGAAASSAPQAKTVEIGEDEYTEQQLRIHWFEFVDSLPQAETALAARMQNMFPDLQENNVFQVKVNNQRIADELNHLRSGLEDSLRRKLNNRHVHMDIKVLAPEEIPPTLTRGEQLAAMMQRNDGLRKLYETLKLELM
jgi:DNA polymerase-3 subunit gamma/tau